MTDQLTIPGTRTACTIQLLLFGYPLAESVAQREITGINGIWPLLVIIGPFW